MSGADAGTPISNEALESMAERISRAFRLVRKRAPKEVQREVRELLEAVFAVAESEEPNVLLRIQLARKLEALLANLRGSEAFVPYFYQAGRLAVVRVFEPVRIRECVDDQRVREHLRRYEERVVRAESRLRWFLIRCGFEVDPKPERPAWEQPYANFEEYHELVWGQIHRGPPGR